MFLRNRWYVAAWDDEVSDKPLARTVLNEPIVLFRGADGAAAALEDRCVHRRMPLSLGWVMGNNLQCRYHGLTYDRTGRCIRVPGQDSVGDWARVRSYPVAERHRWVFVWMGDPAAADEALLPDFHARLDDPNWRHIKALFQIPCHYKLLLDNLLDLSHLAYLHNTSIGNAVMADKAEVTHEQRGETVRVVRYMLDIPPSTSFAEFGRLGGKIDRWQVTEYRPPGFILINNGTDPAGASNASKEERVKHIGSWGFQVYHAITPQSDRATMQFWSLALPFSYTDPAQYERFDLILGKQVVEEDIEAYVAQQRVIDAIDPAKGRLGDISAVGEISADTGLTMGRRILDELVAKEKAASTR